EKQMLNNKENKVHDGEIIIEEENNNDSEIEIGVEEEEEEENQVEKQQQPQVITEENHYPFTKQLDVIKSMGFYDEKIIKELLNKHKSDASKVINELLNQ